MGRKSISDDGELKLCTGYLHKDDPQWLPLISFGKDSRRKSGLMSECRDCWRARYNRRKAKTKVPMEEASQVFHRLVDIYGSKQALAGELGVHPGFLSRGVKSVRYDTYEKATQLLAVHEKGKYYTRGEAEIVEAEPLGSVLRDFCSVWVRERPLNAKQGQEDPFHFLGPVQYLSFKSGISIRRSSGICNSEFPVVPLSQADALLTAANKYEMLSSGEIEIKANPSWSLENYLKYMRLRGCL